MIIEAQPNVYITDNVFYMIMTNALEEYNKNRLEEWNKSTIKRHQTKPYYKCRNMKQFKNLIKDDKIQSLILEMTDRIVEKFKPDAVILHGSYAKGTAKHTSDIDLMVVFPKKNKHTSAL